MLSCVYMSVGTRNVYFWVFSFETHILFVAQKIFQGIIRTPMKHTFASIS